MTANTEVVLAVGSGQRLKREDNLPKCLLPFHGDTLLELQISALSAVFKLLWISAKMKQGDGFNGIIPYPKEKAVGKAP